MLHVCHSMHRFTEQTGSLCWCNLLQASEQGVWCAQIVKLSDAVQDMPRSVTQFVHGVPGSFLAVGEKKARPPPDGSPRFTKGAYFIGKVL